jgi:hypothetical protein
MYHIHALTASGTSSSSFGRSYKRKSQEWLPVKQCGQTCRPTKQSPTVPAHTLMLNCWLVSTQYSFSYNSQIKRFRSCVDMDILFHFGMWNACLEFVRIFQLHLYTHEPHLVFFSYGLPSFSVQIPSQFQC